MALPSPHLSEIPDEGLQLACVVPPDELKLEPDDARVRGDLDLSVAVHKVDRGVHVQGELVGVFMRQCVRCLIEYEEPARIPFTADYRDVESPATPPARRRQPTGDEAEEPAASLEEEEDSYPLAGDRVELSEMLREHIILAAPMQPLCREDCRGLCSVCGQDLNERRCECPEERRNSPFMILQRKAGGK